MFTIDLILKYTAMPVSVQRKNASDAETVYQQVVTAMKTKPSELIELTCEKQPEKKITIMSDQISAVIVSQKAGGAGTGKPAGFIALNSES